MQYDRLTRSMLQTNQPHRSLGNRSGTVETNPDGTTDIYLGVSTRPSRMPSPCGRWAREARLEGITL